MDFSHLSNIASVAWRLCAGQQLRQLAGDDESVLYNDRSGETHLLSAIAVNLLQHLQQRSVMDCLAIAGYLAGSWEFASEDDAEQVTCSLLAELAALGLIETLPS